ncbi:MAG: hypothetical protein FDZ69_01165, partial [Deltaproteobacteria bacterium]
MKPKHRQGLSAFLLALIAVLIAAPAAAAGPCAPCLAFDRLDKQIRDGALAKTEGRRQFAARLADLDAFLGGETGTPGGRPWVFPLRGYTMAVSGPDAGSGYITRGYDYFDGNRHGGHPSVDLFIRDRDQDCLDDLTGEPVTVLSMTGGIVVAAEPAWAAASPLRGGKYLWIYDPTERLLIYYAHNRDLLVGVGDRVAPGTPIATVGRSGHNAAKGRSPTHLHLTVLAVRNGLPQPDDIGPRLRALP